MASLRLVSVGPVLLKGLALAASTVMLALLAIGSESRAAAHRPAGQSSSAAATPAQPSAGTAETFAAYVNTSYRRPLSLPDLVLDPLLSRAAQNHATYWVLNSVAYKGLDTLAYHNEFPQYPNGFTGAAPYSRCAAVGAPSCGEIAYPGGDLIDAAHGWMNSAYHSGFPLLSASGGCGNDIDGSVCELSVQQTSVAFTNTSSVNGSSSAVRIWPYNGATNVPAAWLGSESPYPLQNYQGDRANVGPAMLLAYKTGVSVELSDVAGHRIPLVLAGGTNAADSVVASSPPPNSSVAFLTFFPSQLLDYNAQYELLLTAAGSEHRLSFTTEQPPLQLRLDGLSDGATLKASKLARTRIAVEVEDPLATDAERLGLYYVSIRQVGQVGRCLRPRSSTTCVSRVAPFFALTTTQPQTAARGPFHCTNVNGSSCAWSDLSFIVSSTKLPRNTLYQGRYRLTVRVGPAARPIWTDGVSFRIYGK